MPIERPFDFSGATALVVGGASGLGRAMAETLVRHGASVCIAARTEEKARAIAEDISARAGGRCVSCAADLAVESSVRALNACGFRIASIQDITPVPHNGCRAPKRRRV